MRDARVPHRSRYHTRQRTHRSSTPRQIRRRAGNGESSGDLQGAALRTPGKAHHVGGGCVARPPDRPGTTGGCRPSPPDRSPLQPVIERSRDLASIRTGAIRPAHCARRDGRGQTRTWNASGEVASPCGERCGQTEDALIGQSGGQRRPSGKPGLRSHTHRRLRGNNGLSHATGPPPVNPDYMISPRLSRPRRSGGRP